MRFLKQISIVFLIFSAMNLSAAKLLIPMDDSQKNHLKAYGIAYWSLQNAVEVQWLLNYRGGSFMIDNLKDIENECIIRGVSYEVIADAQASGILNEISQADVNMDAVKLEKAPKIAVYTPPGKQPWDDAVTLVLTYAEIPYDAIYDKEIIDGKLADYDWLHLHHEDFTGQYGKFYGAYRYAAWYQEQQAESEEMAKTFGFEKVSELKLYVAKTIKAYVQNGGFLFAMCSASDTYDIALAAEGVDICDGVFDGDPMDPQAQSKLDYSKTFAFKDFTITKNPLEYEHSDIDVSHTRKVAENDDYFALFEFSAKWDPVPTMLCQNHTSLIKGFMGQSTAYNKDKVKSNVLIMGENKAANETRYLHGEFGQGTWTFYGGHDPEDFRHYVYDEQTELELFPNSPGYRLILNNVLFPAAKKKKLKT
ncbi:MAG: asparagine synthetase B [Bacteroidetes bacterium GWF2_38_335]|nr:MAG: asparagine synthetase B [Bacteroidetes bacterium GWF2_38_335]OFY80091.1 MAG: asparagine synthetase B [Bacteroidetes bacterium RIFOXYA12_FULL_38_20]HBS88585.1 asparagine synthetase B [Bacteroidales bacterium]